MRTILSTMAIAGVLASGCQLDVPDLNNPGIGDLVDNPTQAVVSSACTGLLIGNRRNHAQANGYVAQLGILGREAYNFDQADPRFVGELLDGTLSSGSPFGGNFWAGPYANIRLANTIVRATDKVAQFSTAEKSAIRGFARTMIALDLLEVIATRDDIGAVIDTDRDLDGELAPIVDKPVVLAEIARLLDDGRGELMAGGEFPFALSGGFAGFDKPATFATFNRAVRARVAAYQQDYQAALAALGESFLDEDPATFDVGVYYTYSTGAGDQVNNLINPNIFAHPSLEADLRGSGAAKDTRFAGKVGTTDKAGSAQGLTSKLVFTLYASPGAPVPLIRNEELVLLRAEAKFFTGDAQGGLADLNRVRTGSGGLAPVQPTVAEASFVDELLYDRRYSLLFEGHRWIDVRRFGRIDSLPLDLPGHERNRRYPIPLAECNARPDEPRCALDNL